jgi:DNA polymerase I
VFDGENGSAQRKATDSDYKVNRPEGGEALKPILAQPAVKAGLGLYDITYPRAAGAGAIPGVAAEACAVSWGAPGRLRQSACRPTGASQR